MIILFYILAVVFDAWSDGWRCRSKEWHWQKALMVGSLLLSAMFYEYGISFMMLLCLFIYVLVRFALFDDLTNAFAKREFGYTGNSWWDKKIERIPIVVRIIFRAAAMFLAIMLTIQIL